VGTDLILSPYRMLMVNEVRPVLERLNGNVTECAHELNVDSIRLRAFVKNTPALAEVLIEAREQIADTAEDVLREALTDEKDPGRKDSASRFILARLGRERGYGTAGTNLAIQAGNGKFLIEWADGSTLNEEAE